MAWPAPQIEVLATATATGPTVLATWTTVPAGRLLLALYANGTNAEPVPSGWTQVADILANGVRIFAKVSDGTETTMSISPGGAGTQTTLYVIAVDANESLAGFAGRIDSTITQSTPSDPGALAAMTPASTVDTRIDFLVGGFAPALPPATVVPGVFLAGEGGRAFQRANAVWAIPHPATASGGTVHGATYTGAVVTVSMLLRITARRWFINQIGF